MNITFAPGGILQIDDARIIFRNFSGVGSKYNRPGDRNFAVVIPDEKIANDLLDKGWNVKIRTPRDEGDTPFMYMPIKVKFNDYGPTAYLVSGKKMIKLDQESVSCLDDVEIQSVDMDIRPYDWEMSDGKTGRSAYLKAIKVTQRVDRFASSYECEELPF